MKQPLKFWIKRRDNPQTGTRYEALGQMSKAAARKQEGTLYGMNWMDGYDTEEAYKERLAELKAAGERVQ